MAVVTWGFVVPQFNQAMENKKSLDLENEKLVKMKNKLNDLNSLNEFELGQRTRITLKALPNTKNPFEVLSILTKMAEENGLAVNSFNIKPGPMVVTEQGSLIYKLTLLGGVMAIKDFLKELESVLPLMSHSGKTNIEIGVEQATINLSAESYFQPLPKTLGSSDTAVEKLSSDEEKYLTTLSGYKTFPEEIVPPPSGKANPFSF